MSNLLSPHTFIPQIWARMPLWANVSREAKHHSCSFSSRLPSTGCASSFALRGFSLGSQAPSWPSNLLATHSSLSLESSCTLVSSERSWLGGSVPSSGTFCSAPAGGCGTGSDPKPGSCEEFLRWQWHRGQVSWTYSHFLRQPAWKKWLQGVITADFMSYKGGKRHLINVYYKTSATFKFYFQHFFAINAPEKICNTNLRIRPILYFSNNLLAIRDTFTQIMQEPLAKQFFKRNKNQKWGRKELLNWVLPQCETQGLHNCGSMITRSPSAQCKCNYNLRKCDEDRTFSTVLLQHSSTDYSMMRSSARRQISHIHQGIGKEVAISLGRMYIPVFTIWHKPVFLNLHQNHPECLLTMHVLGPPQTYWSGFLKMAFTSP